MSEIHHHQPTDYSDELKQVGFTDQYIEENLGASQNRYSNQSTQGKNHNKKGEKSSGGKKIVAIGTVAAVLVGGGIILHNAFSDSDDEGSNNHNVYVPPVVGGQTTTEAPSETTYQEVTTGAVTEATANQETPKDFEQFKEEVLKYNEDHNYDLPQNEIDKTTARYTVPRDNAELVTQMTTELGNMITDEDKMRIKIIYDAMLGEGNYTYEFSTGQNKETMHLWIDITYTGESRIKQPFAFGLYGVPSRVDEPRTLEKRDKIKQRVDFAIIASYHLTRSNTLRKGSEEYGQSN